MSGSKTVVYEFRRTESIPAPAGRIPRVACLLALAHRLEGAIRSGKIRNWAEAARLVGVTRARMAQITTLLLLSPPIQMAILDLPPVAEGDDPLTERDLRRAVSRSAWTEQLEEWRLLRLRPQRPSRHTSRRGVPAPALSAGHCTGALPTP